MQKCHFVYDRTNIDRSRLLQLLQSEKLLPGAHGYYLKCRNKKTESLINVTKSHFEKGKKKITLKYHFFTILIKKSIYFTTYCD